MKLRSKLIIAFSVMLVLVAVTTATGWFSMRDMDRVAKQLAAVDNSMFALQRAQLLTLRYLAYQDKKNADSAEADAKAALTTMNKAKEYVRDPVQKKRIDDALAGMQEFSRAVTALISNTVKGEELNKKMLVLSADISKTSAKTLNVLHGRIRDNFTQREFDAFYLVNKADSDFYFMRVNVAFFMANPTAERAQAANSALTLARQQVAEAAELFHLPENKQAVQHIIEAFDSYAASWADYVALSNDTAGMTNVVRTQGSAVAKICQDVSTSSEELMQASQNSGNNTNLMVLFLAFLIGVGITLALTRNITRQLGKDPGELAAIAIRVTNGDYNIDDGSQRMGVYDNIVGMVSALKEHIENAQNAMEQAKQESARAVEAMKTADLASKDAQAKRDSILVAADKLEEVSQVVSSAAEELSAQIEQSERGAAEQAARVSETATAMEEMNSTVLEVARNAANANSGGKQMREKATDGAAIVESSVRGIQKARTDALDLKEDMNALSEQAQSIGQIMNVISDIADQTNLLALNAAIEAARAGEAGRGFAVVADEVRKLAEKTMQSTTDVGTAIKAIQDSAAKNMAQVDATVKNIELSTEQAEKSGRALHEMVEMIDMAVEQVGSIATASEQQSSTSEEINRSISQVNTIATETARAMQEAAQAVSDLSAQAQVLTRLIEDMKKG